MSDLLRSCEHGQSALERVKSFCASLSLPVPTTAVDAQQQLADDIQVFSDYPRLEDSTKSKDVNFAAGHEN